MRAQTDRDGDIGARAGSSVFALAIRARPSGRSSGGRECSRGRTSIAITITARASRPIRAPRRITPRPRDALARLGLASCIGTAILDILARVGEHGVNVLNRGALVDACVGDKGGGVVCGVEARAAVGDFYNGAVLL